MHFRRRDLKRKKEEWGLRGTERGERERGERKTDKECKVAKKGKRRKKEHEKAETPDKPLLSLFLSIVGSSYYFQCILYL